MPAGNFDKFEIALSYGADSIYLAGKKFGLRAMADNLSDDELKKAVELAHEKGRLIYVTINLFARDTDFEELEGYVLYLQSINVDALIVADAGILSFVRKTVPNMVIHLSTQASTMNSYSANFWHDLGAKKNRIGKRA